MKAVEKKSSRQVSNDVYEEMIDAITEEDYATEHEFLGKEPFEIKTTNAQGIYNAYQMFPKILVCDMRSQSHYENWHLKWSVNFPIDKFNASWKLTNFDPEKVIKSHLTLKVDKEAFKKRKQSMVFIVAHLNCSVEIFQNIAKLFEASKIKTLKRRYTCQDILATRNSILLYKALRLDKTREVYICRNSFNAIQGKYPFMCRFAGSSLYMDPKKSNGYPSEIIDRRLYLGDASHAKNQTIIHNLGITHILNVTHDIPNTFEESKMLNITYKRVSIEDKWESPINLSFNIAYDFIEEVIAKKKIGKMRFVQTRFDLVQNFANSRKKSMSLVSSASMTNDIILDLSKMRCKPVKNEEKDKMFEIDSICQYNMQNSNNQNRILVHWAMGRSRSATMVIMYLMRKYQVDLNTAFDIVKVRRDIIDPNEGFMQKLQTYEGKQYKLKRTITVRENEKIDEIDEIDEVEEFSGYSDFEESSSTSSEDLMDQHRDSSGLFKFPNKHKKHSQDEHTSKKCISALGSMEV